MYGQESVMMAVSTDMVLWWVTYLVFWRFHFFSSLSNITYVTSSAATSQVAEIMGGGVSGGGRLGDLGTRIPERVWKSDGFIVRKECP